jgi:hypothetical protein
MDTKLTLKLNENIIKKAKSYAREKNRSLSMIIEDFFYFLTIEKEEIEDTYSPIVKELSGIIKLRGEDDLQESYTDYLIEKYK